MRSLKADESAFVGPYINKAGETTGPCVVGVGNIFLFEVFL